MAPAVGALMYDDARGHLYAGTANGATQADAGNDSVYRFSVADGSREEYATGYSMVGGFGLRPDGVLFVMDDPALLDPVEPMGTGRMFHIGLPAAHIAAGPLTDDGKEAADRGHIADTTPTFEVEGEATVECRLRGPDAFDTGWVTCAEGTFTPAEPLVEGQYTLAVRSVDGDVTGLVEVHRFAVDVTAPGKPVITSPTGGTVSGSPWFVFDAEPNARFECLWGDGDAYEPCAPGRTRTFPESGSHTLTIRAIDRAGNVSEPSDSVSFQTNALITQVTIDSGPEGPTRDPNPTFTFSADAANVEFSCGLGQQAFSACNGSKSYSGLVDGSYTFRVRAMDTAGNVKEAQRTFTVDRRGPVMTVSDPAEGATTGTDVTVSMRANEEAAWRCRIDGQPFESCGATRRYTGLGNGEHVFQVVGVDAAGNEGEVLTRRFTVDSAFVPAPPPPPAPVEPTVTVTDLESGQPLTIRIVDIDRRVNLARIQEQGIRVTVRPATGAQLIRFRIFRVDRGRRGRAAGAPKPVVTVYRKARKGTNIVRLTRKELRRVKPGTYRLEVATGRDRRKMGKPVTRTFRVIR